MQKSLRVGGVAFSTPDPDQIKPLLVDGMGARPLPVTDLRSETIQRRFAGAIDCPVEIHPFQLGNERIELIHCIQDSPPVSQDPGPSNTLWFQHIAIVVQDLNRAAEKISPWVTSISKGPQILPNGVGAYKFRDHAGHAMELLWFPAGMGDARWHQDDSRLFLGIDHSAIAISDSDLSLQFYLSQLSFKLRYASYNQGKEQDRLDGLEDARLAIHGVGGLSGMGIEFLRYIQPAPLSPTASVLTPLDPLYAQILVYQPLQSLPKSSMRQDPDGHRLWIDS